MASLLTLGVHPDALPTVLPRFQHQIWQHFTPGDKPERLDQVINDLTHQNHQDFHTDGGNWTNHMSCTHGYDTTLALIDTAGPGEHGRHRAELAVERAAHWVMSGVIRIRS